MVKGNLLTQATHRLMSDTEDFNFIGNIEGRDIFEEKADVIILDINSIFDYEEKKHDACKKDFMLVAIIDDTSDYDAFKNFGITSWIKRDDIAKLPELLDEIKKRMAL